jgi:hypothetical protein
MVTKEDINKAYDEMQNLLLSKNSFSIGSTTVEYEQEYIDKFKDTILQYAIENYLDKYVHFNGGIMRIDYISVRQISVINFYGVLVSDNEVYYKQYISRFIFSLMNEDNKKFSTKEEFDKMLNGIIEKANTKYIPTKENK